MSAIREEQLQWIDSLTCERLSINENNKEAVACFTNEKNELLVNHLVEKAWEEDVSRHNAYYIVKDTTNSVLFYFSLKSGLLFEDMLTKDMIDICEAFSGDKPTTEDIKSRINKYQIDNAFSDEELKGHLTEQYRKLKDQRKSQRQDAHIQELSSVKVVLKTIPAIELSHFCKNDNRSVFDEKMFSNHRLGEIIFWFKIWPIIQKSLHLIGGQYIYLFAADQVENGNLTNYYTRLLNFNKHSIYGTNKPAYDCSCKFMCQQIADANLFYQQLIDNFNLDADEEII